MAGRLADWIVVGTICFSHFLGIESRNHRFQVGTLRRPHWVDVGMDYQRPSSLTYHEKSVGNELSAGRAKAFLASCHRMDSPRKLLLHAMLA